MALFIPGMPCALCAAPVRATDEPVMFAPFVVDPDDPIVLFHDAVLHRGCFDQHPLAAEATRWHDEVHRWWRTSGRTCAVCGEAIRNPDDHVGTGLLARDPAHPLHAFNFVSLHRGHVARWSRRGELRDVMQALREAGAWRGPALGPLVDDVLAEAARAR